MDMEEKLILLQSYIAHYDGDGYRQCPECGSLDFTYKFEYDYLTFYLQCECDKCHNEWIALGERTVACVVGNKDIISKEQVE